MYRRLILGLVLGLSMVVTSVVAGAPGRPASTASRVNVFFGMKNITVFAKNSTTALAKAQAKNPGWTVVSVTKVNKDPKSMAYRVVLKKN